MLKILQSDIIFRMNVQLVSSRGRVSYQAQALQEKEVIEKQDASGEECPPHVPQRLWLVHACREEAQTPAL